MILSFHGVYEADVPTGNNLNYANLDVAEAVIKEEQYNPPGDAANYNWAGGNGFNILNASVTSVLSNNPLLNDLLLGKKVLIEGHDFNGKPSTCKMVDVNPICETSTQLIIGKWIIEDTAKLHNPSVAFFTYGNGAQVLHAQPIMINKRKMPTFPFTGSAYFSSAVNPGDVEWHLGASKSLTEILSSCKKISIRLLLFNSVLPASTMVSKKAVSLPVYGNVVGRIEFHQENSFWRVLLPRNAYDGQKHEVRYRNYGNTPCFLPTFVKVDESSILVDTMMTVPFKSRKDDDYVNNCLDETKWGPSLVPSLEIESHTLSLCVGEKTIHFEVNSQSVQAIHKFELKSCPTNQEMKIFWNGIEVLREEQFHFEIENRSLYIEQGSEISTQILAYSYGQRIQKDFQVISIPIKGYIKNGLTKFAEIVSQPEKGVVRVRGLNPGGAMIIIRATQDCNKTGFEGAFSWLTNFKEDIQTHLDLPPEYIMVSMFAHVRVLPSDFELQGMQLVWPNVYNNILKYYCIIYPGMRKHLDLSNPTMIATKGYAILQMISEKNKHKTFYMPATREMSRTKRTLLKHFILKHLVPTLPTFVESDKSITFSKDTRFYLRVAAELEHSLCLQYLFAAWTLQVSNANEPYAKEWYLALMGVAYEEMFHLACVQNLLRLLDSEPHFLEMSLPSEVPFINSMQKIEEFSYEASADTKIGFLISQKEDDLLCHAFSIGELYQKIKKDFEDPKVVPAAAFAPSKTFSGFDYGVSQRILFREIDSRDKAIKIIDEIIENGEGSSADDPASHYSVFSKILAEVEAKQFELKYERIAGPKEEALKVLYQAYQALLLMLTLYFQWTSNQTYSATQLHFQIPFFMKHIFTPISKYALTLANMEEIQCSLKNDLHSMPRNLKQFKELILNIANSVSSLEALQKATKDGLDIILKNL